MADFKINGVTFASESGGVVSLSNANVFPAGHVVQVVSGRSSSARYDTNNTEFHSITSDTDVATLTTKFANSKFFFNNDSFFPT